MLSLYMHIYFADPCDHAMRAHSTDIDLAGSLQGGAPRRPAATLGGGTPLGKLVTWSLANNMTWNLDRGFPQKDRFHWKKGMVV